MTLIILLKILQLNTWSLHINRTTLASLLHLTLSYLLARTTLLWYLIFCLENLLQIIQHLWLYIKMIVFLSTITRVLLILYWKLLEQKQIPNRLAMITNNIWDNKLHKHSVQSSFLWIELSIQVIENLFFRSIENVS